VDFIILGQYRSLKAAGGGVDRRHQQSLKKKNQKNLDKSEMFSTFVLEERKQLKTKQYEKGKHQQPLRLPYGDSQ
jgi:hypothetical protein